MRLPLIRRAMALAVILGASILRFWLLGLHGPRTLERRARWVQDTCIRVLRCLDVRSRLTGEVPSQGLVVSNHLSYLDILVLSAAMPCLFVAKSEVRHWPFFGMAARMGGTMFIDRSKASSAQHIAKMIGERLKLAVPVLLFPEGTSTDGTMLRFHGWLYEPAVLTQATITAASIRYLGSNGTSERELCWFGDDSFGHHLLKVLGMPGFCAAIHFGEPRIYEHRRIAAKATFAEIASMRERNQVEDLATV